MYTTISMVLSAHFLQENILVSVVNKAFGILLEYYIGNKDSLGTIFVNLIG